MKRGDKVPQITYPVHQSYKIALESKCTALLISENNPVLSSNGFFSCRLRLLKEEKPMNLQNRKLPHINSANVSKVPPVFMSTQ